VTLRPPELDDAPSVASIFSGVFPDSISPDLLRRAWTSPRFDPRQDARVAVTACGEITGYADAEAVGENSGKAWIWLVGEPEDELAEWAERHSVDLVPPPSRLVANMWSENESGRRLLERRGFRLVRHHFRMAIDLDGATEPPSWPQGVTVRTFEPGDEQTFYEVHQETFEDHWEHERRPYDDWAHWMLAPERFDPELWFLAEEGREPAGVSICHADEVHPDVGWVGILGVRRAWRRRGVGRALLLHSFAEFRRRGFRRAQLGVDAESLTGAVRLYERAGMTVIHRFDSYEKTL
jgi:mycothiol synthase